MRLLATSLPAAAAGALAHGAVEKRLGRPGPTAALLVGSGLLLLAADRDRRTSRDRGEEDGDLLAASLAQVAALVPGVSRSGATLTALRARDVEREQAVRVSLLMSLPISAGAAALTAVRARQVPPLLPSALAAGTAYAATRRGRRSRASVVASVLYRLGIGAAVAGRLRRERA